MFFGYNFFQRICKQMGKMTISGKDCFTKAIPNDDTDIWTPSPDVRMPPILQRSTTRDGG